MSSKSPGILDPLRVRIRRLQLVAGLGFFSLVLGAVLTGSLSVRLISRIQAVETDALRLLIGTLLENLWVLGVLPLVGYGAARLLELKPLSTALGAACAGESFVLALDFVRDGFDGLVGDWPHTLLRILMFTAGVLLTYRAVSRGRAAAEEAAAKAQAQAEARKGEYQEFLRQAERDAEKLAQREAERAAAASTGEAQAQGIPRDEG